MALTQLLTRAQQGIDAPSVSVEVHISNGLPAFSIVGLPEAAVRESRDRVRSALVNSSVLLSIMLMARFCGKPPPRSSVSWESFACSLTVANHS